jgi:regulator of replication initiation timing
LLKRYAALLRERDGMKKELGMLREENEHLQAKLTQAEEYLLAAQISKAMPDEASRAQSRKKLDAVISEIDKILTTIND